MTAPTRRHAALFIALAASMLLLVSCSKASAPAADLSGLAPEGAIERARDALSSTEGFKFKLTHVSGTTKLPGGLELERASGVVKRPGDMKLTAEANFGRAFVRIEAIVIGEDTWMTNPITGTWAKIPPEESPIGFFEPLQIAANIIENVDEPIFRERPGTSGRILIDGKIDAIQFEPLVGSVADSVVNVTLEFDADTFLLAKAHIRGVLQDGDLDTAERLIELSGYGDDIAISPPELG